jgi:hypothetical protein
MPVNRLYLSVLPIIHLNPPPPANYILVRAGLQKQFGTPEQILTLFPDRNFATEFYPDEVELYINAVQESTSQFLTGGHVTRYEFIRQTTDDGRVVVMVEQYVG